MRLKEEVFDVGVIVGRFQTHELHESHLDLINEVCDRHDKVILFLGLSPIPNSINNPLDYQSRKQLILASYPDINVLYIKDQASDQAWSDRLDEMIGDLVTPSQTVVLYGGRDSFISHYMGKYPTAELVPEKVLSATEIRKRIATSGARASSDFRRGVIWASQSRFPTCYTTVDVAVFNEDYSEMILVRKPHQTKFQLCGGFTDTRSPTFETDARREVREELGIDITDPIYVPPGPNESRIIDDWRYRNEDDVIKTTLFVAKYRSGQVRPADDIVEAKWFKCQHNSINAQPNHVALINRAMGFVKGN